jgi:hypothetical protein
MVIVYITVVVLYYVTCTLFSISNCCAHVKAIGIYEPFNIRKHSETVREHDIS